MGTVQHQGITIGYGDDGSGDAILAFHGTTQNRMAWDMVRAAMPAEYRWVTPEFPGSGESSPAGDPLEIVELAAQGVAVMDELGIDTFHVVGYSLGAVVALATASLHPSRVRSVTSLCGWAATDGRMRITFDLWTKLIATDPALFMHYAFADGMTRLGLEAIEPMIGEVIAMSVAMIAPGSADHLELDRRVDIRGLLDGISCPTLVLGGSEDRWVDITHSREIAASIAGAELVELPGGHLVIQELAGDVARMIHAVSSGAA